MSTVLSSELREKVMREYRVIIRSLLDTNSQEIVENASLSHAAVILEEMVRHAKTSFIAVAQSLNKDAWNDQVVQALAEAKQRGVDIDLLVTNQDNASLAHLNDWDFSVRKCIRKISEKVRESGIHLENFAVMDRKALRFEVDKEHASAVFCANSPEAATTILKHFQCLKEEAIPLGTCP
jgi:hypothetical protein